MILTLRPILQTKTATLSLLETPFGEYFTLEDPIRKNKIPGDTAIPEGTYTLLMRKSGGMHARYAQRYGARHRGMLWLQNVPNFEWVYLHIGNTTADTEGCILVGDSADLGGEAPVLTQSVKGYFRLYDKLAGPVLADEHIQIKVTR